MLSIKNFPFLVLEEITTPRQKKNGTRMFLCPRTNVKYGSYTSGYVRRIYPGNIHKEMMYQLNPVQRFPVSFTTVDGKSWSYTRQLRIMIPNEKDRLQLINKRAASYQPR